MRGLRSAVGATSLRRRLRLNPIVAVAKKLDHFIFRVILGQSELYPRGRFTQIIDRMIGQDCETLLDVGCGSDSAVQVATPRLKFSIGIDGHAPSIEQAGGNGTHHAYCPLDIREIGKNFASKSFDVVVCCDVIEHVTKDEGYALLRDMERIARKRVIVTTPHGFVSQDGIDYYGNKLQDHVSGWRWWDFEDRGYRVIGFNGWRPLKIEEGLPRFRPHWFWWRICLLTEMLLAGRHQHSYTLIAIKDIPQRPPMKGALALNEFATYDAISPAP